MVGTTLSVEGRATSAHGGAVRDHGGVSDPRTSAHGPDTEAARDAGPTSGPDASAAHDDAATPRPDAARPPAPRRGMRGSAKSMVISMVVVVAAVIGWLAMVPRVSSVSQPVADVKGIAREVSHAQHWDIAIAQGLPSEWKPTNVRLMKQKHLPKTWQAGYTGPDNAYVAVRQTKNGSADWVRHQVGSGHRAGTATIDGVTWTRYQQPSNDQLSLVRGQKLGGLSTVVTGKAHWSQLEMLAKALTPYSKVAQRSQQTGGASPTQ